MIKEVSEKTKENECQIEYQPAARRSSFADRLGRNMASACLLLLAVSSLKNAALPDGQTVAAAVREMTQLNDHLGAIEFVGNFLPETVAVFLDSPGTFAMTAPCSGNAVHTFSKEEPYVSYLPADDGKIYAGAGGQVASVAHGQDEELILRLRHENGYETLYYGLSGLLVREGDQVTDQTCLGYADAGAEVFIEVRYTGLPVDPSSLIRARKADVS